MKWKRGIGCAMMAFAIALFATVWGCAIVAFWPDSAPAMFFLVFCGLLFGGFVLFAENNRPAL
jgi:hypothetical protein